MRGALVLLVTGCSFQGTSSDLVADAAVDSAMIDGSPDTTSGFCLGDASVTACLTAMPTQALMIGAPKTIHTDSAGDCDPTATTSDYCILAGTTIMIMGTATLSAQGTRPLVLMSSGGIMIAGGASIDVGGHRNAMPQLTGAGGRTCVGGIAATPNGGGYGGTFGSIGGHGGADAGGNPGGKAAQMTGATTLQGGCPGEVGLGGGGTAGPSGGAVALLAVATIQIDGTIFASGGGAGGAKTNNRGGGGGGSGGMIVIDAPVVTGNTARLGANGGAGGEGSGGMAGKDGLDAPADPTKGAAGGAGGSTGGDGGDGATGAGASGTGGTGTSAAGGGGGGGAVGVIKVYGATTLPGNVSPPPS